MIKKNWIIIFVPVLLLTIAASLISLLTPEFYSADSAIIAVKSHYLDLIHLAIVVPVGILVFILALRKSYRAKLVILGIMTYLAFMFGFNALSLFFNKLFLVYIAIFSFNIFGLMLGYGDVRQTGLFQKKSIATKISGIFLLLFALTGYAAWLIEVLGSTINNSIPESIAGMQLPVSVVHVFDMAFALPAIIISVILLFKRKRNGIILSSIMSVFVLFTCISILVMELALLFNNMHVDEGKLYSFYVLTPLSIFPFIALFREIRKLFPEKTESSRIENIS